MHTHEAALHLISVTGSVVGVVIDRESLPADDEGTQEDHSFLIAVHFKVTHCHSLGSRTRPGGITHSLTHSLRSLARLALRARVSLFTSV